MLATVSTPSLIKSGVAAVRYKKFTKDISKCSGMEVFVSLKSDVLDVVDICYDFEDVRFDFSGFLCCCGL